jgi:hypothetical protein
MVGRPEYLIMRRHKIFLTNYDQSAASFCHQMAAWVQDLFFNFYSVKNHQSANNSTNTEAREKIGTDLESFKFFMHV